jgi:predicted alpha/beta-fold hydrolase
MGRSKYSSPLLLRGQHWETMIPGILRSPKKITPSNEIIDTPDGDFLELDWYKRDSSTLVILSHGLEGSSTKAYMKGMAKIFIDNKIDALCWNYRGCGSKMNDKPKLYHSGATYDLSTVIDHAIKNGYEKIVLIGFSLGGNITLKYVGENGADIPNQVIASIAFSTPVDLDAGCVQISKRGNWHYSKRFMLKLKEKVRLKHKQFPDIINLNGLEQINDIRTFDDIYTGPLHGFANAEDYYSKCSSKQFLKDIAIPTLIVNAENDPFLPKECYPYEQAAQNPNITFEAPVHGGHVGFMEFNKQGYYWSEKRAFDFAADVLG